jgi:hypothetical protein
MIGSTATAVIAAGIGLIAWLRIQESRHLTHAIQVQTYGGTNYVLQVLETTIGKLDKGCAVIVYVAFKNPNPYEVVLRRQWFVLVDSGKDYYQPSSMGTQTELIKLPPDGVRDKEALSFAVPDDSFAGTLALQVGYNYYVMLKNEKPFTRKLNPGEFITFRTRDW